MANVSRASRPRFAGKMPATLMIENAKLRLNTLLNGSTFLMFYCVRFTM